MATQLLSVDQLRDLFTRTFPASAAQADRFYAVMSVLDAELHPGSCLLGYSRDARGIGRWRVSVTGKHAAAEASDEFLTTAMMLAILRIGGRRDVAVSEEERMVEALSEIPTGDAACESAYRRGFSQGVYAAVDAAESKCSLVKLRDWANRVYAWRLRRVGGAFEEPEWLGRNAKARVQ